MTILTTELTSINTNKGKWHLILFTGLFAFIFTNIFEPYGLYSSSGNNHFETFLELNVAILAVLLTLIMSHFVIRRLVGIHSFTFLTIFFWFFFESLLIGALWTILTVLIDGHKQPVLSLWLVNVIECVFLIGLPYFVSIFYLNVKEKNRKISRLLKKINKEKIKPESIVPFKEKSGKEKMSICLKDILYIESSDNYVLVHYKFNETTEKYLLRNTIKNLEKTLRSFNIIRCHRSYMVNVLNVVRKEKSAKGFTLYLKGMEQVAIPVSKSYTSELNKIR